MQNPYKKARAPHTALASKLLQKDGYNELERLIKREKSRSKADLFKAVSAKQIPRHIAIIMDGNGRWALARKMPRTAGHRRVWKLYGNN